MTQPVMTSPVPQTVPQPRPVEPELPVELREFHAFWRAPHWRWWRGLLAMLVFGVVWGFVAFTAMGVGFIAQMFVGDMDQVLTSATSMKVTPAIFLANNVSIAGFIPAAFAAQWLCVGQRPRWLSSVVGGLRWRWLGLCALVVVPLWLVYVGLDSWRTGAFEGLSRMPHMWVMIVGILLTTPFQAAGEEYATRGFLPRLLGAWIPSPRVSLWVGAVVSSVVFTGLHAAADPWLNLFYFSFGMVASMLVWRTGGLEASIVIHVVNNLLSEWTMPFTDFSGMFDRSVGAGDPSVLYGIVVLLLAWGGIELMGRRVGVVTEAAPGRAAVSTPVPTQDAGFVA